MAPLTGPADPARWRAPATGALVLGLGLVIGLIAWAGYAEVAAVLATAGWGIVPVGLAFLATVLADTRGWAVLIPAATRPGTGRLFLWRWISSAINNLLPVAHVGGELARAGLLGRTATGGARAGASVLADLTVGLVTLVMFAGAGVALLGLGPGGDLALQAAVGLALFAVLLLAFLAAQAAGLFGRLARLALRLARGRDWLRLVGGADVLDRELKTIYGDRRAVLRCALWRFAGWLLGALEVWLIFLVLGHPVTLVEAFTVEAIGQAVRSAGFAIPGALGVQEGGFMALGALLGFGPDVGLAVSLMKRVRDLVFGAPALAIWQTMAGRGLLRRRGP